MNSSIYSLLQPPIHPIITIYWPIYWSINPSIHTIIRVSIHSIQYIHDNAFPLSPKLLPSLAFYMPPLPGMARIDGLISRLIRIVFLSQNSSTFHLMTLQPLLNLTYWTLLTSPSLTSSVPYSLPFCPAALVSASTHFPFFPKTPKTLYSASSIEPSSTIPSLSLICSSTCPAIYCLV